MNEEKNQLTLTDQDFLMHSPLFDAVPENARWHLLAGMERVHFIEGERFIRQGEEGDYFYIIQKGECTVVVEKDGQIHHIASLGPGDVVGEMAILTGENRSAHVNAKTDMDLWKLSRSRFEQACSKYPEIRNFLTQLVSSRFARATFTADRAIGKYSIREIIGRGGWSVVYRGMHTTLNMPVAIKMLRHHMAMEEDFLRSFHNEARTIANLNHENVVKVYDIEELYRTVFIVMEFLEGASVQDMLRTAPNLGLVQVVDILLQTCAGLGYAHGRGIVHGDIKPGNIFIQKNNSVKILDFGVACATGTKVDRLMGTPKYFSPEQIRMKPMDERSDIYSLGLATFRMLTGHEAFFDMDMTTLCQMHLYQETPNPRSIVPDLPQELTNIILKATQKDPAARYQRVEEIVDDIQPLARKLGIDVSGQPRPQSNMTGLFLFYRDGQGDIIKSLVSDFSTELKKIGIDLRESNFKDVS